MFPEDTEKLMTDYGIRYEETSPAEAEKEIEDLMKLYGIASEPAAPALLQKFADDGYMLDRERYIAVIQSAGKNGDPNRPHPLRGIHTFLLVYDKDGQKIGDSGKIGHRIAYNRYNNRDRPKAYEELADVLENNNRFIQIYKITGVGEENEG